MKCHPLAVLNAKVFVDSRRQESERLKNVAARKKAPTKLLSSTGKTSAQITPDGISIVFQSVRQGHTIHWPISDWLDLRKWIDDNRII